jgi:hypothetical protein
MYVVGRLHSSSAQVILGGEPAFPKDALEEGGESSGHGGEGTAAKRLITKMISLYENGFFDILITDAYYSPSPLCCLWIHWVSTL